MILFEKIRWKNFLSTGNQYSELIFNKNTTTLILGANCSGKSTVLDALTFSLFGKPFRRINKPQLVTMKCDVHSWMSGYLHVLEHEFFSVSDVEGRFEIKGLPPGTYELETWHEMRRIKPVTVQVTVEAGMSHRIDMDLK